MGHIFSRTNNSTSSPLVLRVDDTTPASKDSIALFLSFSYPLVSTPAITAVAAVGIDNAADIDVGYTVLLPMIRADAAIAVGSNVF